MVVGRGPVGQRHVGHVGQLRVLEQAVRDVHPEPSNPPVQPEPEDLLEHRAHPGVAPVPVGLAGVEQVQVPLAVRHSGPGSAAEPGGPVVGRLAAVGSPAIAEDEQRPLRAARRCRQCLLEQRMVRRAVIGHQIDDDPYLVALGDLDELVEVAERAQPGIHVRVVADVVAAVVERRRVEGRQPDRVHAELRQVRQPPDEAGQVADPVTVGVGEASRVHLVHHRARPPGTALILACAHPLPPRICACDRTR